MWEFAGAVRGRLERRNGARVSLKYARADDKARASDSARRVLGRSSSACGGRRVLDLTIEGRLVRVCTRVRAHTFRTCAYFALRFRAKHCIRDLRAGETTRSHLRVEGFEHLEA
jgi:hypothetical protein